MPPVRLTGAILLAAGAGVGGYTAFGVSKCPSVSGGQQQGMVCIAPGHYNLLLGLSGAAVAVGLGLLVYSGLSR